MKTTDKVLSTLLTVCFTVTVLLTSVQYWCFNKNFYLKEYTKEQTNVSMEMSMSDLMESTSVLLDYMNGKRADIEVNAVVSGDEREVFNDREKAHMVDVKALYQTAMHIRDGLFLVSVFLLAYLVHFCRKYLRSVLKYGIKTGFVFLGLFLGGIGVWVLADFNGFWTTFHEILFSNDLWLLDPNTSLMINMFPGVFFSDLVIRILLTIIGIIGMVTCIVVIPERKKI